jgi:NAD+ synthase (glutamine-hydrolysing)
MNSKFSNFKIALAQINPIVGDFEGNLQKHLIFIRKAKSQGVRLIVFSELSLVGYIPRDILLEPHFINKQNMYLHKLIEEIKDIYVIVGAVCKNPSQVEKPFFNSAICFYNGHVVFQYDKKLLPTYEVFDERRYFERGDKEGYFELDGFKIGLTICEDMWQYTHGVSSTCYNTDPIESLKKNKPDLMINLSGSPYYQNKVPVRRKIIQTISQNFSCPMLYVNQVGSNDAIIFDGYSMCAFPSGEVLYAKGFEEDLKVIDLQAAHSPVVPDFELDLEKALALGIKDYVQKNGFQKVVLGLSGGIDSALVMALSVKALGYQNVKAIYMPSRYSRAISYDLATQIAANFKVSLDVIPIDALIEAYISSLDKQLGLSQGGTTLENIQSRIRGQIIMAYANKHQALMMGCSNKSELAMGYGTLYGDIAGALLPIGDLLKVDVYKLSRIVDRGHFPKEVFTRPPSAELYRDQQDSDSLPPYEILDLFLMLYIEQKWSKEEILSKYPECESSIDHILSLFKIYKTKSQ